MKLLKTLLIIAAVIALVYLLANPPFISEYQFNNQIF